MKTQLLFPFLVSSLFLAMSARADHPLPEDDGDDFLDFSLEELISLDIPDVTSVSRKKQRQMDSAAAIYVITSNDIHRSGVTSIPEALRMVPGMQVARLNGNTWSISTRGFNYIFANKLLVLIDGRTVYSPLFSGVNWDVQDTLMEDIDRIEVIRGPGAALWGANAVNGVINVITKKAADTQGSLITAGGGSEEKAFGSYRYGGEFGDSGFYKVYFKAFERDGMATSAGDDASDDWKMKRAGFKAEWKPASDSDFTVQGDIYQGTTRPPLRIYNGESLDKQILVNQNRDQKGGNIIAHWKKTLSENHDYSLRAVYDNYQNFDYRITEKRDTFDLEFQHYNQPFTNHDLVWGAGYRSTWYEVKNTEYMYLLNDKEKKVTRLISAFIQDDISLTNQWTLTLSSRLEHNSFTDYEFQPNARLTWKATEDRTFWAAISKAIKTPSISETELQTENITVTKDRGVDYIIPIQGNSNLKSEKLTAFEFGYRERFSHELRLDATVFYNQYKDIVAYVPATTCPGPNKSLFLGDCDISDQYNALIIPSTLKNGLNAKTYGFELVADWQFKEWWKLQFTYSWLNVEASTQWDDPNFLKRNEFTVEDLSAHNTANLRSSMNLPNQWYLDFWIRYMDNLKNANVSGYTALDIRIAKRINDNLEFSLVGQNLFDKQRAEFTEIFSGLGATEIEESWYAQVKWSF